MGPGNRTIWTTPPQSSSSESLGTLTSWTWSLRTARWVSGTQKFENSGDENDLSPFSLPLTFDEQHSQTCKTKAQRWVFSSKKHSYAVLRQVCLLCVMGFLFFCLSCLCYEGAPGKFSHATFVLCTVFFKSMIACADNLVNRHTGGKE